MIDFSWRFIVSDASTGRLITLLDRRSMARKVTYTLNKAALAAGTSPSDNPEIDIVLGDGHPFLDEGVRNIVGFRREDDTPWVCRFAGRVLMIEDNAEETSGAPYSNWTAYDPRQLLYMRPVLTADGDIPGPNGVDFKATPGDEIVVALIQRTIDAHGDVGIDVAGGTLEPCPEMDFHFEQGVMVGEALDQLAEAGACDVLMDPVWDPTRPTILADLSVYAQAGSVQHHAVFSWDMPGRSLVGINRVVDGTQRANRLRFGAGAGGPVGGTVSDFPSVAEFGEYWASQFFPGQNEPEAVENLALAAVAIRKNGVTTLRVNPAPAQATIRTPVLFLDYFLGDEVPLYASSRFRKALATTQRVYEIPVELRDDGTETISQLSFSADGLGGSSPVIEEPPPDGGSPGIGGGGIGGGGNPLLGTSLQPLMPDSSGGQNIYVDSLLGSDSNNGAEVTPYKTVAKAASVVSDGGIILVRARDYPTLTLTSKRFDEGDPVTIQTHPDDVALGNLARFIGQASYTNAFFLGDCNGIKLLNLKHQAVYDTDLKIDTCQWIEVWNPYVLDAGRSQYGLDYGPQGILVVENPAYAASHGWAQGTTEHISIINPRITNCGGRGANSPGHDHPIYFAEGDFCQVLNAFIHDNPTGYGIQAGPSARGLIVANPTIVAQSSSSPYAGDGFVMWNGRAASDPDPGTSDALLVNFIIAHCDKYGVVASDSQDAPSNIVRDGIAFDNAAGDFQPLYGSKTGFTVVAPTSTADPLFADYGARDLRLQAGSPALAVADPAFTPPFDFFGNDRPDLPAYGAFEEAP